MKGKYDIQQGCTDGMVIKEITPERKAELAEEAKKDALLMELGAFMIIYTSRRFPVPRHPDGIHNYIEDSRLACELVREKNYTKEQLPKDLLERLAYYKKIIDDWIASDD